MNVSNKKAQELSMTIICNNVYSRSNKGATKQKTFQGFTSIAFFACVFVLIMMDTASASCPVSTAGQYILTYNNGTKFMAACKYGDSLRNLCGVTDAACAAGEEGDLEYNTAGSVLRYCNGTNWVNVQCETLTSCAGTTAGMISADTERMKYCNGATWQAMYNDGICAGIGVQEAILTPSNATDGDDALYFTYMSGLAMTDDFMMAGAIYAARNKTRDGAVTVYKRSGTTWNRVKELVPSGSAANHYFGASIAMDGDYAIVGAFGGSRVHFFKKDQGGAENWGELVMRAGSGYSGLSVDLDGDKAIAGAYGADGAAANQGNARIYRRDKDGADAWGQVVILNHPGTPPIANDNIGRSAAISGDIAAVGSHVADEPGFVDTGVVWLYQETSQDNWALIKKLVNPNGASASNYFGSSVDVKDLDGDGTADRVVIGAYGDDTYGSNKGSLFVYERNQGGADNWGQIKKVVPTVEEHGAYFGRSVDLSGTTLVAGAAREDSNGNDSGAVYVFERDQGGSENWGQVKRMTGENAGDLYGFEVAISGDTMVIGAPYEDTGGTNRGAVYVYYRDNGGAGNWGLEKKIPYGGAGGAGDAFFGWALDLSGDILIVGAPNDDTNANNSGYTYVYSRNEGGNDNWGLLATIDPNVPGEGDYFGYSVAVSGNVVAAGGIYNDDAGVDDGAVYVFGCPSVP